MPITRAAVVQAAPVAFDWSERSSESRASLRRLPLRVLASSSSRKPSCPGIRRAPTSEHGWDRARPKGASGSAATTRAPLTSPAPPRSGWERPPGRHGVFLVIGVIERAGGTLYCTALFFGPDGALLGKHRKLMPTAMERLIWGFGDGSTLPVVDTRSAASARSSAGRTTCRSCASRCTAAGVQLYCAPTVDDRETWLPTMRHIALEGRCFVLSANQFARRGDYPADYPIASDDPATRPDRRRELHRRSGRSGPRRAGPRRRRRS